MAIRRPTFGQPPAMSPGPGPAGYELPTGGTPLGPEQDQGGFDLFGLSFEDLLKLAATGVAAYSTYKGAKSAGDAAKQSEQLTNELAETARRRNAVASDQAVDSAALRRPAVDALKARLSAGQRATPDLSGLRDTANPFTKRFSPVVADAAPAAPGAGGGGGAGGDGAGGGVGGAIDRFLKRRKWPGAGGSSDGMSEAGRQAKRRNVPFSGGSAPGPSPENPGPQIVPPSSVPGNGARGKWVKDPNNPGREIWVPGRS